MASTTEAPERASSPGLEQSTLCGAFQAVAAAYPDRVAIRTQGDAFSITWGEYAERVRAVAAGLAALGLKRGDTIGLMLSNRPEFHIVDAAAMHLGATPYSVYNTYTAEQIEYLAGDAENAIFVTEQAFLDTVLAVQAGGTTVKHVVVVDGESNDSTITLDELIAKGDPGFDFEAAWRAVQPDDVLTLIYTSGTTGPPKGVQLTHDNVIAAGQSFDQIMSFPEGARVVSYLPMAHIAERACSHYLATIFGFTVTDVPDPRQVVGVLPEVRPTWFFSVPRIYEKLKSALEAGMAAEQDEQKKQATAWALDVGRRRTAKIQAREPLTEEDEAEWAKADAMVLSKIRAMVGLDAVEAMNVGAAPTPPETIAFYHSIGLPLAELWGMSETTGSGTCNRPGNIKIGTIGPVSPNCEVKLDEDSEILIRGRVVMPGYRNLPDKTAETFTDDGWLRTGDIGSFDDEGFLTIIDRKKELIINAAGKNMSPSNIEAKVKTSHPLIGQAVCIGDRRQYNVALITLDPDAAPGFAQQNGLDPDPAKMAHSDVVNQAIQEGIDRANEGLARVEQIKKFVVLEQEWEPGGDELTPTMKLKRKPITEKYEAEIESLYS